ncbi:hypothetical protein CPAR01_13401 [Colletotrichum paranaense]|uniref:Uncharacterized protein n=5 Tax=Colletotrichum acutatum species complex TaxID=2707335 RepID=A0A9Q8WNS9_9PEZI|nr:uncharacterized protein CLUP02_15988 [Colletotrichum lupini]XP_060311747.1 uncharacterized protein CCOS01_08887 [Colletotrichum costaricense]XP_060344048.1 uncharacterized protein CPAR01_13401 [Colletotrichum paranaense]XP_060398802.1 uncharacterized protein CABS01_10723 [Colletotrichum abscissum]KAI3532918.1 hypothetical protein CSPX01_13123 [Colletotrichum filicis]KAK1457725.1 hypothetical protein CMEL01_15708 [Colletotrichum melonis]KAK1470884.1 hypothetical protein CCUS01_01002 [Collet
MAWRGIPDLSTFFVRTQLTGRGRTRTHHSQLAFLSHPSCLSSR